MIKQTKKQRGVIVGD